jgi:5-methylcytosine-specific restriction endonuclease McrA
MRTVPPWIGRSDNAPIPDRVRLRIFVRAGGVCGLCHIPILAGDCEIDHIVALADGGGHYEGNLHPVHRWCHTAKTGEEANVRARAARKRIKHVFGHKKKRSILAWRRFDGTIVRKPRERD